MLLDTKADIVSIDAYGFGEHFMLYPNVIFSILLLIKKAGLGIVVFVWETFINRSENVTWKQKIFRRLETCNGKDIVLWGM
ncbi:MAG: hypothetical protein KAI50_03095 [Desulfobacterales bacterium]|nr:hypothetical protein [Desulfobacterales bacterium]